MRLVKGEGFVDNSILVADHLPGKE